MSEYTRFSLFIGRFGKMSGLTRDGMAEPIARGQILKRERMLGKIYFPAQLSTNKISA